MDALHSPFSNRYHQTDPREALDAGNMHLAENAFRVRSGRSPLHVRPAAHDTCPECGTTHAHPACPFCHKPMRKVS